MFQQLDQLNDTQAHWSPRVELFLINKAGSVVSKQLLEVELDGYSVYRTPGVEIFPEISDGNFEGFILATTPEVRVSRRTTLNPAAAAPRHEVKHFTQMKDGKLHVAVTASTYIHELSILPELIALGTQVESQNVSLLPGEEHIFVVCGNEKDLQEISQKIDQILWSHNRIVNQR